MIDTMFSANRIWRYTLSRRWTQDVAPRFINFILLNPSTADETRDDPTIRRCIGFARREGFTAMVVTNIFAFRATKPRDMMAAEDPVGEDNDQILVEVARKARLVILGWGNHGQFHDRGIDVLRLLSVNRVQAHVLGWTRMMQPRHPLYASGAADLLPVVT